MTASIRVWRRISPAGRERFGDTDTHAEAVNAGLAHLATHPIPPGRNAPDARRTPARLDHLAPRPGA